MKDLQVLREAYECEVKELTTPSGFKVVIREQNGNDDDIISSSAEATDGTAINRFVASIVVDSDITPGGNISLGDVLNMRLSDKYFIILASRIFSIGQILKFEFIWDDIEEPIMYEEDLGNYIWNYSTNDFPGSTSSPDYFKYRLPPSKSGKDKARELTLKSGKQVRYTYLNGLGEKFLLLLPEEKNSKNQELIARGLQLKIDDGWVDVENFRIFSTTDMAEIRNDVYYKYDPILNLYTDVQHPKSGKFITYPIMGNNDFFFPREI